jgi:hypothetical protein
VKRTLTILPTLSAALPFKPRAIRSGLLLKIGVIHLLILLILRRLDCLERSDPDGYILYLQSGARDAQHIRLEHADAEAAKTVSSFLFAMIIILQSSPVAVTSFPCVLETFGWGARGQVQCIITLNFKSFR